MIATGSAWAIFKPEMSDTSSSIEEVLIVDSTEGSSASSTAGASSDVAPVEYRNLDQVFKAIKSYGRYQLFIFLTVQWACFPMAANSAAGFFSLGGLKPDYHCHDQNNIFTITADEISTNSTQACFMVKSCSNLTTTNAWYSMYEEYEWVCAPDYVRSSVASFLPFATMIGYSIAGHFSDYFGRKWLVIAGFGINLFCGFAQSFTPSWEFYIAITVLSSIAGPVYFGSSFALMVESVNSKYRMIQGFAFQWSVGYILAGISAYLTGNWRTHLLVMNCVGVPALIAMFFLQESPRFLIQRGKYAKAAASINRIARFNNIKGMYFDARDMMQLQIQNNAAIPKKKKHYTVVHLFANKKLTLYAISQILCGIAMNIIGSVMFYNIQDLSGNPLMNVSLMGALRLWTPFAAVLLENGSTRFGRKTLMVSTQTFVCICFTAMFFVDLINNRELFHVAGTALALAGYVVESSLVWIAYKLYTTELFPTVIRAIALSTFSTTSLLGSVLAPQMIYLKKYWHPLPYCGAAITAALAALMAALFLPETKFVALPDTIHEAKNKTVSQATKNKLLITDSNKKSSEEPLI
ncbi:hypothetical protein L596_022152 [Steinernema carpocapsae]|uniref:Major facilitator superfamily (MFS) profile domain-containing protein n=1 Tax=Steinernema carpocapsae TaxID=34508 RepID=A0A4U5MKY7_STECR|nr:hypothetical protein L596_022152 [Steinernema carpocapsae]